MEMDLFSSITQLHGIGPARAAQLEKLGIRTLYDLISYFPRAYEDRTQKRTISELEADEPACFDAMVVSSPHTAHIRKGLDITKVMVADETGKLHLTFFNQPYLDRSLQYGETYSFYGALRGDYSGFEMQNPVFESQQTAGTVTNRILPVYGLTAGLGNSVILRSVRQALDACLGFLPEILPETVRTQYGLCDAAYAYETVHNPPSMEALATARRRLVFEEFFIFSAGLEQIRGRRAQLHTEPYACGMMGNFYDALPYRPTKAQFQAINEILTDFASGVPMNRLLQGDVGSGKTLVAAAAAFCAIKNGRQAVIMAPTEILAEQHADSLSALFEKFGMRTVLLTGSLAAAAKRKAKLEIASGEAQLIIGTHALLTEDVVFSNLGLVVADEQHRFGVSQRTALYEKGRAPHLLVMSATPIPRTLALIAYGDLNVSVLNELPPGRQPIDTFLIGEDKRLRCNSFIRKQCLDGHQVYIVCPAVEESDLESLKSAETWAETLQQAVFPDLRVGLLHGKMKGAEKDAMMSAFSKGELDILVATTVVEVGMDVPNATVMVIENADRFGLSQLHQLRGRVGRGSSKSYCILFSSVQNAETLARLRGFCATNDGFRIAEQDLAQRGPGDFLGSRQHGLPVFRAANLQMDLETLKQAQDAAAHSLASISPDDPGLAALRRRVDELFSRQPASLN
jgi:ATP-dependent DNA helicase RecG